VTGGRTRIVALAAALGLAACGGSASPTDGPAPADAAPLADAAGDLGATADGTAPVDAGGDLGAGGDASHALCTFNADCPAAERCECDLVAGCSCELGARGTGVCGVDPCVDGNDCATALCVEGASGYYCSCPCSGAGDCGPQLPVCAGIAGLGQICIRQ
jgi:hypothetical protein